MAIFPRPVQRSAVIMGHECQGGAARERARRTRGATLGAILLTLVGLNGVEARSSDAANLPEGAGRDELTRACAQCHPLAMALAKRHGEDEWRDLIHRMIGLGAQVDAPQATLIQRYLATNFGSSASSQPGMDLATDTAPEDARPRFPRPQGPNQWPALGGGDANQNYSPLTQITPRNVAKLKQAWVYHYGAGPSDNGDEGIDYRFEATPLIIGGVMYVSTPAAPRNPSLKAAVTALEPETGRLIWKYESPLNIHGRGLAYWPGDAQMGPRVFFGTDGGYIFAVDVTTGKLARGFGKDGRIDAYIGVASEIVGDSRRSTYTIPNPATVYRNLLITGARPGEVGPPGPRGDIRAWDATTGRLVWSFHTVPQPGEPGHENYTADEWRDVSGANVWSSMSIDETNGILFAPTGDLNSKAKGSQLYASSLLAIDAATGELKWFRQITHHDIWDWDLPTPPMLLDVVKDGRKVPAVLAVGKHGLMFLFNRLTGESLNGFEERPTPRPDVPSGEVWPTQPFPSWPAPLARTQMTRDEIPDLAPGMGEFCRSYWDENRTVSAPLYAPRVSTDHGLLSYPSATGGPNWGGGSYNPHLGLYFINLQNIPTYRAPVAPDAGLASMNLEASAWRKTVRRVARRRSPPFSFQMPDGSNVPCAATPWGELVAVDVHRQKIVWRVPLGMTEALGAKGGSTGAPNLGGSIVTASGIVFIGATNDRRLRAFEARSGRTLWETVLEASAHATPITYLGRDGKQYVAVAAAGGTSAGSPHLSDALVAFALP